MSPRIDVDREHIVIQSVGITILLDRDQLRHADRRTITQLLEDDYPLHFTREYATHERLIVIAKRVPTSSFVLIDGDLRTDRRMMGRASDSSRRSTDWIVLAVIEVVHGRTVNCLLAQTLARLSGFHDEKRRISRRPLTLIEPGYHDQRILLSESLVELQPIFSAVPYRQGHGWSNPVDEN